MVIGICPAPKAFWVSLVLRPRFWATPLSIIPFHQSRIFTPGSPL